MTQRKKLIEVALPLEAINVASAREKSIRHGHPSTLHLWWERRPLAACRAVIFTSLVDHPDDPNAPPEFVDAYRKLPKGKNATANDTLLKALDALPSQLETAIACDWAALGDVLIDASSVYVLGRGPSLAIAQEAALKVKETCGLHP